ncbi:MAG: hypothetical protein AAFX93_02630 [Verrucomicrobiota bacterium]
MIRVRRSSIQSLPSTSPATPGALCCTLQITIGENASPVPGLAIFDLRGDDPQSLFQSAEQAACLATENYGQSFFKFWRNLRDRLEIWKRTNDRQAAFARFGLALVERAILDAFCRSRERSISELLQTNAFEIDLGMVCSPLKGRQPHELMEVPREEIPVRLQIDPAFDLSSADALQRLVTAHSLQRFSLELQGNVDADFERIQHLVQALDHLKVERYRLSFDGMQAFEPQGLKNLWDRLETEPTTSRLGRKVDYIEQPFAVENTFANSAVALFAEWPNRPPILIDEADAIHGDCARSLEWGYSGSLYRAERGFIPTVVDACLIGARREREPVGKWTYTGGLINASCHQSMTSDTAVAGALGFGDILVPSQILESKSDEPMIDLTELREPYREIALAPA